jgi:protease IV
MSSQKLLAKYRSWQTVKPVPVETKIGVLKIKGEIRDIEDILHKIYHFSKDNSIKAVLLAIDSGGGACGSSEMLFREIRALSKVKPVVTVINNLCCSGAYWVAIGSSWIIAPSGAEVGNIGVVEILTRYDDSEIKDDHARHKIHYEFLHAGKFKGLSHPHRGNLTEEEKNHINGELEKIRLIFAQDVAQHRNIEIGDWHEGQSFTAREALQLGLIDQEGSVSDALEKIKDLLQKRGVSEIGELIFIE